MKNAGFLVLPVAWVVACASGVNMPSGPLSSTTHSNRGSRPSNASKHATPQQTAEKIGKTSPPDRAASDRVATSWEQLTAFKITMAVSGRNRDYATWEGWTGRGEASIQVERSIGGEYETGSMLLVAGSVLAIRGLQPDPNDEVHELDRVAVALQVVLAIMKRLHPDGPAVMPLGSKVVEYQDVQNALRAGTPTPRYGIRVKRNQNTRPVNHPRSL